MRRKLKTYVCGTFSDVWEMEILLLLEEAEESLCVFCMKYAKWFDAAFEVSFVHVLRPRMNRNSPLKKPISADKQRGKRTAVDYISVA